MKDFKSYVEAVENYSEGENYFDKLNTDSVTPADINKYIADLKKAMKENKFKDEKFTKSLKTLEKTVGIFSSTAKEAGLSQKDLKIICTTLLNGHVMRYKGIIGKNLFTSPRDRSKDKA